MYSERTAVTAPLYGTLNGGKRSQKIVSYSVQQNPSQVLVLSCYFQSPQRDLLIGVFQRDDRKIRDCLHG